MSAERYLIVLNTLQQYYRLSAVSGEENTALSVGYRHKQHHYYSNIIV
jgi:hypothetical protein